MLYNSSSSGGDPYRTAVIDTIVAEVQSIAGEDRCVLLLGYKVQMEEMFQASFKFRLSDLILTLMMLEIEPWPCSTV